MAKMSPHANTPPARSAQDPLRQITTEIARWQGAKAETASDELVAEEPLEVRLRDDQGNARSLAVIMRTPGHDEELVVGFLYTEGLLRDGREIVSLAAGLDEDGLPSPNVLDMTPSAHAELARRVEEGGYSRAFAVNASCGVCGKNSVAAACAAFPVVSVGAEFVAAQTLYRLPDQLRVRQDVFSATGGLHAAALFNFDGNLVALREDVGRHNAVDKLIGRALLDGALPVREQILLVSGRMSFEIALKALAAGIPIVAVVSAPSSLAVEMCAAGGVTLVGFLRGETMNVYTHGERIR
ncbi:MAG TPA: formate dehydrogenase accessory sulfurtransferase FdhD [Ktedonobacterales bacterium]